MIYEQYTQFGCPDELGPQLCRLTSQTGLPLACSVALNLMDVFKAGILTKTMSSIGVKKTAKTCLPDLDAESETLWANAEQHQTRLLDFI